MAVGVGLQIQMIVSARVVHGDKRYSAFNQSPGHGKLLTNVIGVLEILPWINRTALLHRFGFLIQFEGRFGRLFRIFYLQFCRRFG